MDIATLITEHGPEALGVLALLLAAGWGVLKFVAPFTKTDKDDKFVAKYGEAVEDTIEKLEERGK